MKSLLVAAVLVLLGGGSRVAAQPTNTKQEADQAAADAEAKFNGRDYTGASERWRFAYSLDADPGYLFDIAQAYRFANDCSRSADYYRQFLEKVPSPPNLDQVKRWLASQETCIKASAASEAADADAKLKAGQYTAAVAQLEHAYQLDPDPRFLLAIAKAYGLAHDCPDAADYYRRFLATVPNPSRADTTALEEMEACAKPHADADHAGAGTPGDASPGKRRLAIVAVSAGAVALGFAGFFTWDAHYLASQRDNLLSACSGTVPCLPGPVNDYDDRGHRAAAIAITGYAIGGAAVAAGIVLLLTARPGDEHAVAITPTRDGAMISGRFVF